MGCEFDRCERLRPLFLASWRRPTRSAADGIVRFRGKWADVKGVEDNDAIGCGLAAHALPCTAWKAFNYHQI